jgi:hypothetical protein
LAGGWQGSKGKTVGAYLTDSTIANYNTLYRLHIAQKISKDTITTILHTEHQRIRRKGGWWREPKLKRKCDIEGNDSWQKGEEVLTILWAEDEKKAGTGVGLLNWKLDEGQADGLKCR